MASLYIKDPGTAELDRLARRRGIAKTEAVRRAVQADLDRDPEPDPEHDVSTRTPEWIETKMADFCRRFPPLDVSGITINKTFWDDIVGDP